MSSIVGDPHDSTSELIIALRVGKRIDEDALAALNLREESGLPRDGSESRKDMQVGAALRD